MIKFLDVQKINARFEKEFQEDLKHLISKGQFVNGDPVTTFEKEFAAYCGTEFCIGTGNGLDALTMILKGAIRLRKLKTGDEVLVPAHTFIATIISVLEAGLIPVLVDANPYTFNISVDDLKRKISPKTKAIIGVHLYGQLAAMDVINQIARAKQMLVIEDAAQAHGAKNRYGTPAGNLSYAAAFSFYPAKNLGALGDGGAITTNDPKLADVVRKLGNYGSERKYSHHMFGLNSRLDALQAAFLSRKLKVLDEDNSKRRAIAKHYIKQIKNEKIKLPLFNYTEDHVFHLFVIRCEERDRLEQYLTENEIQYMIHYPIPPHQQEALKKYRKAQVPITEKLCNEVLSLPISPVQSVVDTEKIIACLNAFQ